jgi:hypothetical protein
MPFRHSLAERALIEWNVGIDPHELDRPLLKPDRRVSRAGKGRPER